jgi:hypothetical protein
VEKAGHTRSLFGGQISIFHQRISKRKPTHDVGKINILHCFLYVKPPQVPIWGWGGERNFVFGRFAGNCVFEFFQKCGQFFAIIGTAAAVRGAWIFLRGAWACKLMKLKILEEFLTQSMSTPSKP